MKRVVDRHRLKDLSLRKRQSHRIAKGFAEQRVIVNDQEAGHNAFPRFRRTGGKSAAVAGH
ncbi:hypothetical protein ACF1BQ_033275 [Bradyrhizobium sp. RDT10]